MRTRLFLQALMLIVAALLFLLGCGNRLSRKEKVEVVIKTARSFKGTPYKWGGTTRKGMDCSGLLLNSFQAIGQDIPRTTDKQKKLGKKVPKNEIRKGDLVFFATSKKKRKITHVGLVTEVRKGEVFFIHASTSKGVMESSLDNPYWKKRFRMARRVIR